jgi:hypothetical protein
MLLTWGAIIGYLGWENILVGIAFIAYAVWWAHDLRNGIIVRGWSLVLHVVVYSLLFVWLFLDVLIILDLGVKRGIPAGGISSAVAFGVLAFWACTIVLFLYSVRAGRRFAARRLVMQGLTNGRWSYSGLAWFPLLWLVLTLVRMALEVTLLNGFSVILPVGNSVPPAVPWWEFLGVAFLVEALYIVSFGLMTGISVAVWSERRHPSRAGAFPPIAGQRPVGTIPRR